MSDTNGMNNINAASNAAPIRRGILIAIEGLDGSGTTTQSRLAVTNLLRLDVPAHLTREPSDNPIGRLLREFIVGHHGPEPIDPATLALLFAADQLDHLQREVEPQLARGRVVVSDRWYHSSLAYQGDPGSGLSIGRIRAPDLTIFLHVDPAIAARRRVAAGRALEMFDDEEIQRWVRDVPCTAWGYMSALGLVRERGERLVMLDGEASMGAVEANISRLINDLVLAAASGASA